MTAGANLHGDGRALASLARVIESILAYRPSLLPLATFVTGYILAGGFAQSLAIVPGTGISIWPASGLFIATLLLSSREQWWWWVTAGFFAEMTGNILWFHNPWPVAILLFIGNALEATIGAWLVNRAGGRPIRLESLRDVVVLVLLGACVAPIASATMGSVTLHIFGIESFVNAWPLWWIGDATGVLIVAPLALAVSRNWRGRARLSAAQWVEAVTVGLVFLGVAALSLSGFLPFAYIIMPPLLWAAVRFDFNGATLTLTMLAAITAIFTITGASQFAGDPDSQKHKQIMLQLFLAISAFSALVVAAISRQHQLALQTLRQSEKQLQQLIDAVPALIWSLTADGKPCYLSKRATEVTGLTLQDLIERDGSHSMKIVHPDDRESVRGVLKNAIASGSSFVSRYRQVRAVGPPRWVESRAEPLRDESGLIVQWYGVSVDIDDMVTAQQALRGLADTAIALTSCRSTDAVTHEIAERARNIVGAHMAVIGTTVNHSWAQSILSVSLSEKYSAFRNFAARPDGTGIYSQVCELNRPMRLTQAQLEDHPAWRRFGAHGGQHPPLRGWLGVPLIDSDGKNMGLLQLSDKYQGDFTEEDEGIAVQLAQMASLAIGGARLHESLASSKRQLQEMIDAVPVRIWSARSVDGPLYLNKRYLDYLRSAVPNYESLGAPTIERFLDALVHPDDAPGVRNTMRRSFEEGHTAVMRFRWAEQRGVYRWAECRVEPRRGHDETIVEWYGVSIDVDDEVRAQEALRLASDELARASQVASLAELSASIAHELNQPLAAIIANSHACDRWLSADPPNVERARITAARIIRNASSAADVISRVRALFNKSGGSRTSEKLDNVVFEARELMIDEAIRRRVRLEIEIEKDIPTVEIDRVQIQQVLINLLRNGMDAMDQGLGERSLNVCLRRQGDDVHVIVSDSGAGIQFPDRVFEPFFTTKHDGMGMGLSICRSIIEAHGGRLWAEENQPCGATFVFSLPICSQCRVEGMVA